MSLHFTNKELYNNVQFLYIYLRQTKRGIMQQYKDLSQALTVYLKTVFQTIKGESK